jgi:hypothetical protein
MLLVDTMHSEFGHAGGPIAGIAGSGALDWVLGAVRVSGCSTRPTLFISWGYFLGAASKYAVCHRDACKSGAPSIVHASISECCCSLVVGAPVVAGITTDTVLSLHRTSCLPCTGVVA